MSRFLKDRELPLVGMDAADLQDLVENRVPDDVVDYHTIMVSTGKLQAGWAVPKWTRKITVTHEDLTAEASEQTLTLFTLGTNEVVLAVAVRGGFGGPILVFRMSVGVTGETVLYRGLLGVESWRGLQSASLISFINTATPVGGTDVVAYFKHSDGRFVNAVTGGSVDIHFLCSTLS